MDITTVLRKSQGPRSNLREHFIPQTVESNSWITNPRKPTPHQKINVTQNRSLPPETAPRLTSSSRCCTDGPKNQDCQPWANKTATNQPNNKHINKITYFFGWFLFCPGLSAQWAIGVSTNKIAQEKTKPFLWKANDPGSALGFVEVCSMSSGRSA